MFKFPGLALSSTAMILVSAPNFFMFIFSNIVFKWIQMDVFKCFYGVPSIGQYAST